jgi:hypothetical protein
MYISTTYYIGDRVYFYDAASDCVTRATVKEIRTTQYRHNTRTVYLLEVLTEDGPQDMTRDEDELHREAASAFRANPLPVAVEAVTAD